MTSLRILPFLLFVVLAACSRGGDGVPQLDPDFVETQDPDEFLSFPNQRVSLPAGTYTIVAGTQSLGDAGNFSISVERDNGSTESYGGEWTASGGTDETSVANPRFAFNMYYSGGARFTINASTSACLYLLDPGGTLLHGKTGSDNCANPVAIDLPQSKINNEAHAVAYYKAIDPDNTRDTLQKWIAANGFGTACPVSIPDCETHVIFRDTKDLGYGRDMYLRRHENGAVAIYVRNFAVDRLPGLRYTTLNLDAAVDNDVAWHFGSNAIEFSTYPYGPGEPRDGELTFDTASGNAPMFTKYYTFAPRERVDGAIEDRLLLVDLDQRGLKSMPGPCISCHGGTSRPLLPDGTFSPTIPGAVPGDTFAHLQTLEVDTLGFSTKAGYSRIEQEANLRILNQAVLDSYRIEKQQYTGVQGYWDSDFAAELMKGRYGGNVTDVNDYTLPDNAYSSYAPMAWQPDNLSGTPPAGSSELFAEVIGKHCMVCHDKRGTTKNRKPSFFSFQAFSDFSDKIEFYVYHRGVMPLGILNFDQFWDNSGPGRAELMASYLTGFSSFDGLGNTVQPGHPVAVPVAPANTNVPVIISAEGSPFASRYQWSVVSAPVGSNYSFSNASSMRTEFTTDIDGTYTLRLSVSPTEFTDFDMTVSSALPVPSTIRFSTDIRNVLQANPLGSSCAAACHRAGGEAGVPVYYTDPGVGENRSLYNEVIARVSFTAPLESPLLTKPSNANGNHFGGLIGGFDLSANRANYDLFLNWILQGSPQ